MSVVALQEVAARKAPAPVLIDFDSVVARFGPLHAMGPTTLQVRHGEFVVIIGQANSEIAAGRYLGAVGGLLDFVRGAQGAPGGRSIMALPSTTADGRHSRIVAAMDGRPVTISRSEADMVVTEFGVAELRGCGLRERARRVAAIAHPDFRDRLLPAVAKVPA